MPINYKIDVLGKLKEAGYNTNRLRKEKILGEATIQKLRENKPVSWNNISTICELLDCKIEDILVFSKSAENEQ